MKQYRTNTSFFKGKIWTKLKKKIKIEKQKDRRENYNLDLKTTNRHENRSRLLFYAVYIRFLKLSKLSRVYFFK